MANQPKVKTILDRGRSGAVPYHENAREHRERQAFNRHRRKKIRIKLNNLIAQEVRGME